MLGIEVVSRAIDRMPRTTNRSARDLARRLGWFSLVLGAIEILAPRGTSRFLGVRRGGGLVALSGLREVATGMAILSSRNPAPFVWARVAGDVLDLAALLPAMMYGRHKPLAGFAFVGVAMIAAVDTICAQTLSADMARKEGRTPDYNNKSGLPKPAAQMRGLAAKDFKTPADMKAAPSYSGATLQ